MRILGIETSCDETSAAVLADGQVLSNVISSQFIHAKYGGVVPELASRAHQELIIQVVEDALGSASVAPKDLEGIAVTVGPGLLGALLVGLTFAKGFAYGLGKPFIGVNHMEGHLYSPFLSQDQPAYPFVSLIVSGGHTMLVYVEAPLRHRVLGQTRDDAAGEAFDKVARMLGLGYPGGPVIDRLAATGNPNAIRFPRSTLEPGSFDFSFSGIKTAVLYYLRDRGVNTASGAGVHLAGGEVADICASFQQAVVDVLVQKTLDAAHGVRDITIAGGVSANSLLRKQLAAEAEKRGKRLFTPSMAYCMDNGAMIALVGEMRFAAGEQSPFDLDAEANLTL